MVIDLVDGYFFMQTCKYFETLFFVISVVSFTYRQLHFTAVKLIYFNFSDFSTSFLRLD